MLPPIKDVSWSSVPALGYEGFDQRPFIVFWEITRACALACRHCRAEAQITPGANELTSVEAEAFVDQLVKLRPPKLVITGGDPLMRADVFDLIRKASSSGLNVALSPSATDCLLETDFAELKSAGVRRISLSLDGASRASHDAFRGVAGTYTRTIAAVHRAHAAGLSVQINTTLTRSNLSEFGAFKQLMHELRPDMWSLFLIVPTGRARMADMPDAADVEMVFEDLAGMVGSAPFAVKTTEGHHFRRVLIQKLGSSNSRRPGMVSPVGIRDGRGVVFVSHSGVVSPSGFLPFDCGNIRHENLEDIYRRHPLFISLRNSDALSGKCGRCQFRQVCGGSRARAFAVSGDPFAEDPSCNYQPRNTPISS